MSHPPADQTALGPEDLGNELTPEVEARQEQAFSGRNVYTAPLRPCRARGAQTRCGCTCSTF